MLKLDGLEERQNEEYLVMNRKIIILICSIFYINLTPAFADPGCSGELQLASASTWDNVMNTKDSLKFKTSQLINSAIKDKQKAEIVVKTIPNKILKQYSDKEYCDKKLQQTSGDKKLIYKSTSLNSADAVNEWISGLSQGKNTEGKSLYEKCDKTCSPEYEYLILFDSGKFNVKAAVTCGHARDKNDNKYKLSASCDNKNS